MIALFPLDCVDAAGTIAKEIYQMMAANSRGDMVTFARDIVALTYTVGKASVQCVMGKFSQPSRRLLAANETSSCFSSLSVVFTDFQALAAVLGQSPLNSTSLYQVGMRTYLDVNSALVACNVSILQKTSK
jgi:hypothetical protein